MPGLAVGQRSAWHSPAPCCTSVPGWSSCVESPCGSGGDQLESPSSQSAAEGEGEGEERGRGRGRGRGRENKGREIKKDDGREKG